MCVCLCLCVCVCVCVCVRVCIHAKQKRQVSEAAVRVEKARQQQLQQSDVHSLANVALVSGEILVTKCERLLKFVARYVCMYVCIY